MNPRWPAWKKKTRERGEAVLMNALILEVIAQCEGRAAAAAALERALRERDDLPDVQK